LPIGTLLPLAFVISFSLLLQRRTLLSGEPGRRLFLPGWWTAVFGALIFLVTWGTLGSPDPVPVLFALFLSLSVSDRLGPLLRRVDRIFCLSWTPVVIGCANALLIWWFWGSLREIPISDDEASYLLQAEIFASGRWTAPACPIPEFFEQVHVFVTPVLAGKYPPGHSILLVPGIWLGLPGLVPVILGALGGAFLFALARRISNAWVALLAWVLWTTAPAVLQVQASYFSQTTSTALWMAGWWALLKWRDTGHLRWLLAVGVSLAWGVLTRPLTALAFMVPVVFVVFRTASTRRAWQQLAVAGGIGIAILCLLPFWNLHTVGDWRTTPYARYSQAYFPYEKPGFGVDPTPPLRTLPSAMEAHDRHFRRIHREHTVSALPELLGRRLAAITRVLWGDWRFFLLLFALLGSFALPQEGTFALLTSGLLVLAYLFHGHSHIWTIYYFELQASLAFLTALGFWRIMSASGEAREETAGHWVRLLLPRNVLAALLLAVAILCGSVVPLDGARQARLKNSEDQRLLRAQIAALPATKAIVFVRHSGPGAGLRLVRNGPDLQRARAWVVHDRGGENERLLRLAPERVPYLYDTDRRLLFALPEEGVRN